MAIGRYQSAISRAAEMCKDYDKPEFVSAWNRGVKEDVARELAITEATKREELRKKAAATEEALRGIRDSVAPMMSEAAATTFGTSASRAAEAFSALGKSMKDVASLAKTAPKTRRDWLHESMEFAYRDYGRFLGTQMARQKAGKLGDSSHVVRTNDPTEHLSEVIHNSGWRRDEFVTHGHYASFVEDMLHSWNETMHMNFCAYLKGMRKDSEMTAVKRSEEMTRIADAGSIESEAARSASAAVKAQQAEVERLKELQRAKVEKERREADERELAAILVDSERAANPNYSAW